MTMQKVAQALEEALTDYHPNDGKIREALAFVRALIHSDAQVERGGRRWKHLKRGSEVTEIGRGELQSSRPIVEGEQLVFYRHNDDGKGWHRPVSEFDDGRFEELPSTPSPSDWEAGAEAMREDIGKACEMRGDMQQSDREGDLWCARARWVRSLPIPRRP